MKDKELVIFEQIQPLQIFSENKADDFLSGVEKEVDKFKKKRDVSTPEGRKEIKAFSYKIAQSKSPVDQAGLNLTEEMRGKISLVNAERSRVKEKLQSLQDDVRQPLTDFEDKEKLRIESFQNAIADMEAFKDKDIISSFSVGKLIYGLGKHYINMSDWQEFEHKAKTVFEDVNSYLVQIKKDLDARDAEQAELEKLRKEKEERDQKDRDEQIRKEATEKVNREAQEKIEIERKKQEDEKYRLEAEKKAAEQAKINAEIRVKESAKIARAAKEQAKIEAENAKERALEKQKEEFRLKKEAEIEAEKEREADVKHRTKINNEALLPLLELIESFEDVGGLGANKQQAKEIIRAIAKGKVPHISIKY